MGNVRWVYALVLGLVFLTGCAGQRSVVDFVREGGLETKGLINLALASNGTTVFVSGDNPDHPASTLINGVTSSENWNQGEGWEYGYEGRFSRGSYMGYGMEDPYLAEERGLDESFDSGDASWRGLRMQTMGGRNINTALGWVIIQFPEKKIVNRAVIYTIDSAEYPAGKFGVRDLVLQYWNDVVSSWASVERIGKAIGQTSNAVHDNESGVVTLRFQPVETSKMRLVVRWTNDSKERRRGYYTYASGTVRLVEVEVYGYESEETTEDEEITAVIVSQDANKIAEIKVVIENYVDGYNRRNVDVLMSSISPDYSKDGEKYSDLRKRMESVFAKYERLKLELQDVDVNLTDRGATAMSNYMAQYNTTAAESAQTNASGVLIFQLSDASGNWKITRIDSQ